MGSQLRLTNELIPVATTVLGNEKAWTYMEIHLQSPDSRGRHRYRIIVVNRDGRLAEYREDMGSAKKFKGVKELNIPSLWEHSVDELRGLADELRNEVQIDIAELIRTNNFKLA